MDDFCQLKHVKKLQDTKLELLDYDTFMYLLTGFPRLLTFLTLFLINDFSAMQTIVPYQAKEQKNEIGLFQKKSTHPRRMESFFNPPPPPSHLDFLKHKPPPPPSCLDFWQKYKV